MMFGLLVCRGSAGETEEALQFARETLAFVERSATRPELAAELALLEKRFAQSKIHTVEYFANRVSDDHMDGRPGETLLGTPHPVPHTDASRKVSSVKGVREFQAVRSAQVS